MDDETAFLSGLLELQYGRDVENKLVPLAQNISWAEGWPKNNTAFWNAEAFMWERKISKDKRALIHEELQFLLERKGKNLDLGCGAYSYVKGSTGFDFSEKMLQFNDNCQKKVIGNLENYLPFPSSSFDSITAVFILNYIKNWQQLIKEAKRVIKPGGFMVIILSALGVKDWQRQKEVNNFNQDKYTRNMLVNNLMEIDFNVKIKEKDYLLFYFCKKESK
jgi:SAM-dependent methyltransferase